MGSELEGTVTFSQASIFFAKPKAFQKTLAKMGMKKMSEVVRSNMVLKNYYLGQVSNGRLQ